MPADPFALTWALWSAWLALYSGRFETALEPLLAITKPEKPAC